MTRILLGLILSGAVAYLGYVKGALSLSGMVGALLVGTLTFGLGGWDWGIVLIAFFVSSSLLSRYRAREKTDLAEKFAKGSRRDLGQTFANGGLGALLAIGSVLRPHPFWLAAYVGVMATVNADTWATEVGVLSRTRPRLITNGKDVEAGTSGGVTWLGTSFSLAGGAFIGLLSGLLQLIPALGQNVPIGSSRIGWALFLLLCGILGGLAGSLFDSFLGATVQAIYFCDSCAKETEQAKHRCGAPTRHLRGWRWLNNDMVNLISSAVGAILSVSLVVWFYHV